MKTGTSHKMRVFESSAASFIPQLSCLPAVLMMLIWGGCTTMDGNPTAMGSYGQSRTGARSDRISEAARNAMRLEQAEAAVNRMQNQLDSMGESQQRVLAQSEGRLQEARQEAQSMRLEIEQLKKEMANLRSDQQQVRNAVDELPGKISRAVAAARPPAPPPTASTRRTRTTSVGYEHIVEAGQTLSEIARAYGVRMDAIVRENNLKDASSIMVGQKLFIPKP